MDEQQLLLLLTSSRICLIALRFQLFIAFTGKNKVPFSMAIGNGELMHWCFPKHLRMGTTRINKIKKQTKEVRRDFNLIRWFLTATSGTKPIIMSAGHVYIILHQREKWGSTIQYGYRKRGAHAQVFSQTLKHGNSKNEIRQWGRRRHTEERRKYGKKYSGHE